jgi:hypothetical protein
MSLITRAGKGSSLSYAEMDGNLEYLENRLNLLGTGGAGGTSGTSGTSGIAGTSGTSGRVGTSGTSGTSGIGTSGTSGTAANLSNYVGDASIDGDLIVTGTVHIGRWLVPDSSGVTQATDSIFIGHNALPRASGEINQIVIGTDAVGNGDDTATIGNIRMQTLFLGGLAGEGIVLTSPNGTKYRISVTDAGVLTTTAI